MSVPEQLPIVSYIANGATTSFEITFDLHDDKYLLVTKNKELMPVGSYSIQNGFVVFGAVPITGDEITLARDTQLDRETNFKSYNNSFRAESLNWDLDKLWHVLQEQNLIDAKVLARLKQEIEWRRTHDFNYDELAQVREKQIFDALKGYADTLVASTKPNIFQGVIAGVVFAKDGKSIQTHIEEILGVLAQEREDIDSKAEQGYVDTQLNLKANSLDVYLKNQTYNKTETYTKSEMDSLVGAVAGGHKGYATLALAQSDQGSFPVNSIIEVTNDATVQNNGLYHWSGTTLTKSAYDPLAQANKYTDSALKSDYIENLYSQSNNFSDWNVNPSSGTLRESTGVTLNVFPVVAGQTYKLKTKVAINKSYVVVGVSATSAIAVNKATTLLTLSDTTDALIKEFTVPSSVAFAFINVQWTLFNVDILNDTVAASTQGFEQVVKKVSGKRVYDEQLNNRFSILDKSAVKSTDFIISAIELYNQLNENKNLYVNRTNATLAAYTTSSTVTFPVVAGRTYYIRSPSFLASPCVGLSATQVLSVGGLVDIVYLEDVSTGIKKFTVPSDTTKAFAAFTTHLSSQTYNVVGSISVSDTVEQLYIKKIKGLPLTPELPSNFNQRFVDVEAKVNNSSSISPLFALKWAVIGDSITEKNFRTNKNYHDYVAESVNGMSVYNYGKSGDTWGGRSNIPNLITQVPDIITVFLGTNDFGIGARAFGTFKDGAGVSTVCGSIELLLTNLVNKFPTKRLGILLPLPRYNSYGIDGGTPNSFGYTLRQVSEMIVKYANQFGIPYLDLFNESGLAVYNNDANIYYFTAPTLETPDGVHPNDLGHQLIARKVRKFLESII